MDTVPLYRPIINEMNLDSKIIFGHFNVFFLSAFNVVLFVETKIQSLLKLKLALISESLKLIEAQK